MRLKLIGQKHSEEWKENMRNIMTGRIFSEEWKQKIRNSHIGELNPSARKIVLIDKFYHLIKTYNCIKYAADELGLHISHIQDVCEKRYSNTGFCKRQKRVGFRKKFRNMNVVNSIKSYR